MKDMIIAPSILSADFNHLNDEIKKVESAGAEFLHFDVMDGHFVPNISFGIPVLKSIKGTHNMKNDVHIMISDPLFYAEKFCDCGADFLTFHLEACKNENEVKKCIQIIAKKGVKVGISIKPKTPVKEVIPYLNEIDMVLVMSVEPGFGGQHFIIEALEKIKELKKYIVDKNLNCLVEVDGGINEETGKLCKEAGADVLVAGSYLFGHEDIKERIEKLR